MINLKQAIIVEGKYDKIKLSSFINSVIITTNGFSLFKDKEKCEIIRYYAKNTGIIILTDSDTAGFKIRNHIKSVVNKGKVTNVYIPDVFGKEKRKQIASKEGKIGVEGISKKILLDAFEKAGVLCEDAPKKEENMISRLDFYDYGFSGRADSSKKRKELLSYLGLPELLTTTGILEIINSMMTKSEFENVVEKLNSQQKGE